MKFNSLIRFGTFLSLAAAFTCATSCARQISSEVYEGKCVGEASTTYSGVIAHVRQVTVQEGEFLQDNALGIVGGGVGGALVGSQIGKGSGNTLATIGGALAGATAGAFAEKALKTQNALEYTVHMDDGKMMTVVQGPSPAFSIGQNVYVVISTEGRSRVIAR
jgi:outer membrane lipoprotein SlyB